MFYKVYNGSNLISKRSKFCKGILSKFIGFMFNFSKDYDSIILKSKNSSIHMFFVFFTLKIIWLDSNFKVIETKKAYPFMSIYPPKKKSDYILELKKYSKINVRIGDQIKIKPYP